MTRKGSGAALRLQRQKAEEHERHVQEQLTPLVQALLNPDESRRRAVVEHVLRACLPAVVARLVNRLVELLGQGGEVARRQAIACLAQFGHPALPALLLHFQRGHRAAVQRDVLAALRQMAPGLGPSQAVSLMQEVATLAPFAADEAVCLGLAEAIARLRRVTEGPGRKAGAGQSPATTPPRAEGLPGPR
jgi:hypothetical protein